MKVKNYSTVNNEIRLVRYRKKGILRIIFSRLGAILLLLLFQLAIFYAMLAKLEKLNPYYTIFMAFFTIVMVLYLFNCSMDYSAKLTWLIIIALAPVPGSIFLAFTRIEIGHRALKKMVADVISKTTDYLSTDKKLIKEIENKDIYFLSKYLNKTGCFPVYNNTEVQYYPSGEACFSDFIEELKKAEKYIFLEFFIIEEGHMWGQILKVLTEKVKEGVEVRVMYDGMCEMQLLPYNYTDRLKSFGIKAKTFAPIHPFVSTYYNYRDHRKIAVIDGKVAMNGGINLADEYINKYKRYGYWKDAAVIVHGAAVKSYTLMFLQMWSADERTLEIEDYLSDGINDASQVKSSGYVLPFGDIPLDNEKVGENVYMDILNKAEKYVHIMTPYMILDDELKNAIRFAAGRGVDVSIILPGIPDKKVAYALAKSHYKDLLDAGISIYEYTPGFVHSKVFVSDDEKAVVGTINLDYRSLYHHFECATYIEEADCISDIEADFQKTIPECRTVSYESVKHEKLLYKLVGGVVKTMAPLI